MMYETTLGESRLTFSVDAGGDRADPENEGQGFSTFGFLLSDLCRIIPPGFQILQTNRYGEERRSSLLGNLLDSEDLDEDEAREEDAERNPEEDEDHRVYCSDVDAAILFLALAVERGESLSDVEWNSEGSAFWLLHDVEHVRCDTWVDLGYSADGENRGAGGIDVEEGGSEEGATVRAAVEAVRSGFVPTSEVLRELVDNATPFRDRFGYDSSALDSFLALVSVRPLDADPRDEALRSIIEWTDEAEQSMGPAARLLMIRNAARSALQRGER